MVIPIAGRQLYSTPQHDFCRPMKWAYVMSIKPLIRVYRDDIDTRPLCSAWVCDGKKKKGLVRQLAY